MDSQRGQVPRPTGAEIARLLRWLDGVESVLDGCDPGHVAHTGTAPLMHDQPFSYPHGAAATVRALVERATLDGYQDEVAVTHRPDRSREFLLGNYGLGVAGEAGEVADLIKKHLYHEQPLDEDALKKEAGDVLWYVAALCLTMGWSLADVAAANIRKLRARHNGGAFSPAYHAAPDAMGVVEHEVGA